MAQDNETFARELIDKLLEAAFVIASPQVARWSQTLADAMTRVVDDSTRGKLYIPHFWAVYVNDGRGPVHAKKATFLCWFRDPGDDPRFAGRTTPERAKDIRRLTASEWDFWIARNRFARAAGQLPPMVVIGPMRQPLPAVSGKKFFDNTGGMAAFHDEANRVGKEAFREHVRTFMGDLLNMKLTTSVRLPIRR